MEIRRFSTDDFKRLELQPAQADFIPVIQSLDYAKALISAGECFTVLDGDTVIACCGVQEHSQYRAEMWSLLSKHAAPYLRQLTRAVSGWIHQCQYTRLEANVQVDFESGVRWVKLLGFEQEGPARRCFMYDGKDAFTFARFK